MASQLRRRTALVISAALTAAAAYFERVLRVDLPYTYSYTYSYSSPRNAYLAIVKRGIVYEYEYVYGLKPA